MLLLLPPAARRQRRRLLSPSGEKGRGEEASLEERYRTGRPHLPFAVCAVGATRHVRCADAVAGLDRRRSCRMWRPMQGSRYCASSSSYACDPSGGGAQRRTRSRRPSGTAASEWHVHHAARGGRDRVVGGHGDGCSGNPHAQRCSREADGAPRPRAAGLRVGFMRTYCARRHIMRSPAKSKEGRRAFARSRSQGCSHRPAHAPAGSAARC